MLRAPCPASGGLPVAGKSCHRYPVMLRAVVVGLAKSVLTSLGGIAVLGCMCHHVDHNICLTSSLLDVLAA